MKKYQKPIICEQQLDREASLIQMSQPTQPPGDEGFETSSNSDDTSNEETTTKDNNFDENPFER